LADSLATPSIRPTTSSDVTPRSNEIRSILFARSRSIRSFMPLLAFGSGVSATTNSLSTIPIGMVDCCGWSALSAASRPSTFRPSSG
jgi:hypothetical protein